VTMRCTVCFASQFLLSLHHDGKSLGQAQVVMLAACLLMMPQCKAVPRKVSTGMTY